MLQKEKVREILESLKCSFSPTLQVGLKGPYTSKNFVWMERKWLCGKELNDEELIDYIMSKRPKSYIQDFGLVVFKTMLD